MNKELDEKLVKDFPLLYRDRHVSMQSTAMCWGFPGSGWYKLIYELSAKLEKLIVKYQKDHPNLPCRMCGCQKEDHYGHLTSSPGKCLKIHKRQTRHIYSRWGSWKWKWQRWYYEAKQKFVNYINFILGLFFYKLRACWCEKYDPYLPCASQIKEKFGSLRVYLTSSTDEMEDLISEAETKSTTICEECGKPGELRNGCYWYTTLCEKHAINKQGNRIPTDKEVAEQEENKE